MPIAKLPPLLVNQIAAGEVIERPASVVKELVENCIDAGATRIEVVLEDGGRELIRISDDGSGITAADLPLAVAPHATSKLQSSEQLAAISTMGFRGEALASIASVSRVRIASRPTIDGQLAEHGHALEAEGEHVSEVTPIATAPGTVIEVRDLFFNTPARRKFLRTAATEFGHINDLITRIAMAHPAIAFRVTHGNRTSIDLAAGSHRRRCVELLGNDLDEALLEFENDQRPAPGQADGGMTIWGLAGLPAIARATAKFQYVCINGRIVRDRNLNHAIREAYRGLIPPDRQPMVVVFLDIDPRAVDVNVHPTKAEVRFREPSRVHGFVLQSLRARLLAADLTPAATPGSNPWSLRNTTPPMPAFDFSGHAPTNDNSTDHATHPGRTLGPDAAAFFENDAAAADASHQDAAPSHPNQSHPHRPVTSPASVHAFVDYFRRMDPGQKGFVYQQVRQAMAEAQGHQPGLTTDDDNGHGRDDQPIGIQASAVQILQVHKSFVVTQDEHGIVIVDQHALHERVMFEELRQRIIGQGKSLESQRLLMPATLKASPQRQALLEELTPLLTRLGIEADVMGPGTLAIHAFPTFLFDRHVDPVAFMEQLLDKVDDGSVQIDSDTITEATLHEVLDMMACKAAVKAGDHMTQSELAALLARRDQIERSSNCPHGRPTTIRLSIRDLEKQFGRT